MPGERSYKVIDNAIGRRRGLRLPFLQPGISPPVFRGADCALSCDVDVRQPSSISSLCSTTCARLDGGKWTSVNWRDVRARRPLNRWLGAGGSTLRQLVLLKEDAMCRSLYLAPADAQRTPDPTFLRILWLGA